MRSRFSRHGRTPRFVSSLGEGGNQSLSAHTSKLNIKVTKRAALGKNEEALCYLREVTTFEIDLPTVLDTLCFTDLLSSVL